MYLFENPVLQRELLVNLRMPRAFVLLLLFQAALSAVVFIAWPQESRLDLSSKPESTKQLVDLFFLGQYVLASLIAPSFAAGTITGEKERKTYEMLLASPLKPEAIVMGKAVGALAHLTILIFASLPIVMLCIPLGGISPREVFAAYVGLILSIITFGMISVACSSYFNRTAASLVVSYLLILPLALLGVLFWSSLIGETRLNLMLTVVPGIAAAISIVLFYTTCARLLHPPDVGSEGKEVVDLETEAEQVIGLVIQRDQFPDRLFAPPKRNSLMEDRTNPVYDKEVRSEIFSQGTLMLRLVIQISMALAIPIMAWTLFITQDRAPWFISYVVLFNILVGPVFNAGSMTSERERQTLDLLLTTILSPWKILWGKLLAGLRVSSILTAFLLWPLVLACILVTWYWSNLLAVAAYLCIVALTCLTTAVTAMFFSTIVRKTSISMMASYLFVVTLFCLPLAFDFFATEYFPDRPASRVIHRLTITSPFATAFNVPFDVVELPDEQKPWIPPKEGEADFLGYRWSDWSMFAQYCGFTLALNGGFMLVMVWLFTTRWRLSSVAAA